MERKVKLLIIRLSHWVSGSSNYIYNFFRIITCLIDKIVISKACFLNKCIILVYQQGRVASTSVFESLKLSGISCPIFHVHYLSSDNIDKIKRKMISNGKIDRNIILSEMLNKQFKKNTFNNKIKIITIIREPVGLMLSLFFLNFTNEAGNAYGEDEFYKKNILDRIYNIFINDDIDNWDACNWFTIEFQKSTGINIFNHKFNTSDQYFLVKESGIEVLILKFEEISDGFNHGIPVFTGIEKNRAILQYSNPHKDNTSKELHDYVINNLKLPVSICKKIYSCKYVKHFYSQQLIDSFIRRWSM